MKRPFSAFVSVVALLGLPSCMVMQRDHDELVAKTAQIEKDLTLTRADLGQARTDLEATRTRLDNALRANADSSSDIVNSKQRINDLAGRYDEVQHDVDGLKKDVAASRTEIYSRIDDLKRSQTPPPPAPTPITAPADKATHLSQIQEAHTKKDWPTVRALGQEYVNRYPTDEHADQALFIVGDADLADGRPTAALGSFNRLLKLFPKSPFLDRTLFDMGDAYLLMHDCTNAKAAYEACEKRFSKEPGRRGVEEEARDDCQERPPASARPDRGSRGTSPDCHSLVTMPFSPWGMFRTWSPRCERST